MAVPGAARNALTVAGRGTRPSLWPLSSDPATESPAARLLALYTGALADVLDRRGLLHQTLPPEIAPLRRGMRLAGPAYPVAGRPRPGHDYDTSIRLILEMLGSVPAGHVAVYQTEAGDSAQLGELSVTSLKSRGCAGVVLDGGCRDVDFILRQDFPVFARYLTPQDSVPRWELLAHGDVTVTIGDVEVAPGDWVVGDWDGIVVVPAGVLGEVLAEAEAKTAVESEIRGAVRDGVLPIDAYGRYGTF
jgi:4-hydroxy-4-methyl-2-oxoglutarate aldolase